MNTFYIYEIKFEKTKTKKKKQNKTKKTDSV